MSFSMTLAKWATNYDSPRASLGSKLRTRRIAPLLTMIEATFREHRHVNILDVGGTRKYWSIIPTVDLGRTPSQRNDIESVRNRQPKGSRPVPLHSRRWLRSFRVCRQVLSTSRTQFRYRARGRLAPNASVCGRAVTHFR